MRKMWLLLAVAIVLPIITLGLIRILLTYSLPEGEVEVLEEVEIGGVAQWILANGQSEDLPVLLWLHGGPGAAQMPVARYFNSNLEEEFIVVHWDQRGAGKSNAGEFTESSMTVEQYIQDVHEMTQYLQKRFDKEKIFLLGHSWGSQIGVVAASRYPENYHAYIGVGQLVNPQKSNVIATKELQKRIMENGNMDDLDVLESLTGPPYTIHSEYITFAKLLDKYGMNMDISMGEFVRVAFGSGVYTLEDYWQWLRGANRGSGPMWEESQEWDLLQWATQVGVPCYFIVGANDYNTPAALVSSLLEELEAPIIEVTVMENVAHTPFFADPSGFFKEMKRVKNGLSEIRKHNL